MNSTLQEIQTLKYECAQDLWQSIHKHSPTINKRKCYKGWEIHVYFKQIFLFQKQI